MKRSSILGLCGVIFFAVASSCIKNPYSMINISKSNGKIIECTGQQVSKKLRMQDFHAIVAKGCIDVEYTNGPVNAVITAPEDAIKYIIVKVNNGNLELSTKDNVNLSLKGRKDAKICLKVSSPVLDKINILGASDVNTGNLTAKSMEFNILGTGDITTGVLNADNIEMSTKGVGDINIKGAEGTTLNIHTMGVGDISVSNIRVTNITATMNGVGDITLSGECDNAELISSGTGDINARHLKAKHWSTTSSGVGDINR